MRQPIESSTLLDHLQALAGEHRGTESTPHNRSDGTYSLELFAHPTLDMITIASNGLRHIEKDVPFGEEVVCTLRRSQAGYTRAIMGAICELILQSRTGLEYDQILDNDCELFDTTHKEGLLASTHPYFDERFNYVAHDSSSPLTNHNVELQIVTLVPITRSEIEFAARDTDALYELWTNTRPDLLDVTRPSTL
ncbi:suppressor of fused domain protein [Kibdelosporangium aridum]|uniref:Suppressor of fused protein (SUFU) n=1 Tax=Kibdelosporangium aridum TaxID=2030 RepID=A0A1W2G0K0_KIBAR|nr:suppressor of fused domain protein [Kibdelosporangium aridum]SMD27418.1 Suppressor of fused protein (SUFU) [Kibdelosporangium aridum]